VFFDLCGFSLRPLRFKIFDRLGQVKPFTAKDAKKGRKEREERAIRNTTAE